MRTARLVAAVAVELCSAFTAAEFACIRARFKEIKHSVDPRSSGRQVRPGKLQEKVETAVEALMIMRLTANQRSTPLLEQADIHSISRKLLKGSEVIAVEHVRTVVTYKITSTIHYFSAIDDNLYQAFWKFVARIYTVAAARNLTPIEVVEDAEARAAVYAPCMTPEAWRQWTEEQVDLVLGATPGGASNANPAVQATLDQMAATVRELLNQRSREIWPQGND